MIRHCIYKVQQKADTTGDRWLATSLPRVTR